MAVGRPLPDSWVAELEDIVGKCQPARAGEGDPAPTTCSARTGTTPETTAVLSRLFVAPRTRGHRFGAVLIGRAVEEARGRGLRRVHDVVASGAAAAACTYGWGGS